jgi:hypothetical protein
MTPSPQASNGPLGGLVTERMNPDVLIFDERNPRLQGRVEGDAQSAILEILWREFAVDEIALSIAANGYFEYEPLFVALEDGSNVVIEGNRRLAAVKLLLNDSLRRKLRATDLPQVPDDIAAQLRSLPVIKCQRNDIWRYVGFKHVNGPKPWDAFAKAEYITWVRSSLGVSLVDIARQIGDRHATVIRLYNGLRALMEVEESGLWNRERRWNKRFFFSHLYTALGYEGFQAYLDMDVSRGTATDTPVPQSKMRELSEVCVWLFGDKETQTPPIIVSQNPDLRRLDEALKSPNGVDALRQGLTLSVSLDIARGDDRILRENLVTAKSALQTAKARLVTGYHGEEVVRKNASDVYALADSILDEIALIDEQLVEDQADEPRSLRGGRRTRPRR